MARTPRLRLGPRLAAARRDAARVGGALLAPLGVRRVPRRASGAPIERICADLHRLDAEIEWLQSAPTVVARWHRLQAVSWAYDDVLREACVAVGVPAPPIARATVPVQVARADRLVVEAELAAAGLRW